MLLLGLTGSIATGKSTVSRLLSQAPYHLPIIDADQLARQVVEPGTAGYDAIVKYFGPTTPDLLLPTPSVVEPGSDPGTTTSALRPLNRAALGRRVFGDDAVRKRERAVLNGIVHPAVRRAIYQAIAYHYVRARRAVVLDVPLLFESGLDVMCGVVVVVAMRDPAVQMRRLMQRDAPGLTADDARRRVLSQGDVREKASRALARGRGAGYVLWNDDGPEELAAQLAVVVGQMQQRSPAWWAWLLWAAPPVALAVAAGNMLRAWWWRRRWREEQWRRKTVS
ncbi:MAG: hypothetical protein M1826_000041 [Phylliscum demangeonii]|nr:MAG: hypothetical protein M1826_000041 [Phylliscum demangeonii]